MPTPSDIVLQDRKITYRSDWQVTFKCLDRQAHILIQKYIWILLFREINDDCSGIHKIGVYA